MIFFFFFGFLEDTDGCAIHNDSLSKSFVFLSFRSI